MIDKEFYSPVTIELLHAPWSLNFSEQIISLETTFAFCLTSINSFTWLPLKAQRQREKVAFALKYSPEEAPHHLNKNLPKMN